LASHYHQREDQYRQNWKQREKRHERHGALCIFGEHRHRQHTKASQLAQRSVSEDGGPFGQCFEPVVCQLERSQHLTGLAFSESKRLRFVFVRGEQNAKRRLALFGSGQRGPRGCELLVHRRVRGIGSEGPLAELGSLTLPLCL
jgi:hypothetical protein